MERGRLDLEHVACLGREPFGEGEGRRAEEMDVHIARTPEEVVFEVVALEVGEAVAHVGLARKKGALPDRRPAAQDAARAADVRR